MSATPTRRDAGRQQIAVVPEHEPQASPQMSKFLPGPQLAGDAPTSGRTTGARRPPADSLIGITADGRSSAASSSPQPRQVYRQIMDIYDKVGGLRISSLSAAPAF